MSGDRGVAWGALAAATGSGVAGEVIASFRAAVYLRLGGHVVALVTESSPAGPLHARLTTLPTCRPGVAATLRRGEIWIDDMRISLPVGEWHPEPIADPLMAVPLLNRLVTHVPALDLDGGGRTWAAFVQRLDEGDLAGACVLVAGLGAGLTPAGDDVAAGAMFVHALTGRTDPERLADIARKAPTHEISLAFLAWAARGQAIEPAHFLVDGAAAGSVTTVRSALRRLSSVGHTSGRDIAAGITAALGALASVRRPASNAATHTVR